MAARFSAYSDLRHSNEAEKEMRLTKNEFN